MSQSNQIQNTKKDITESVSLKIASFVEAGELAFPEKYSYQNALKGAMLVLNETLDKNNRPVLETCTRHSIANAVLEMCVKGLSVIKKQGYFIAYGEKLTFQDGYFGKIAMVKRIIDVETISAQVIYEDDVFEYGINPENGMKFIIKHEQSLGNEDDSKIVGAYAVIVEQSGITHFEVMPMKKIRQSWAMRKGKDTSPAHDKFPGEMAKKTVINRLCKTIINSSDDGSLEIPEEAPDKLDHLKESGQLDPGGEVVQFDEPVDTETGEIIQAEPKEIAPEIEKEEAPKKDLFQEQLEAEDVAPPFGMEG